jgi:hypothetical protein
MTSQFSLKLHRSPYLASQAQVEAVLLCVGEKHDGSFGRRERISFDGMAVEINLGRVNQSGRCKNF